MVLFLQVFIFLAAILIRRRALFGTHLQVSFDRSGLRSYVGKYKGEITARHIGLAQKNGISFIVKPERWYHRVLKNIGIASEVKISNSEFDEKYFITTDFPNHLEQILASGELLSCLQDLFRLPVQSLHATSSQIWCVIGKHDFREEDSYYGRHIDLLEKISHATDATSLSQQGAISPISLSVLSFGFVCVHAGLLAVGFLGALPAFYGSVELTDVQAWVITGLVLGGCAAVIWFMVFMTVLRKSSWIAWVFADFLLCGIIGFALSGVVLSREANIHLPQPPAVAYELPIQERVCILKCSERCGRRCTRTSSYRFQSDMLCSPDSRQSIRHEKRQSDSICANRAYFEYSVTVPHWSEPESHSFTISQQVFDSVKTGSLLQVPVNRGALGLEWVDPSQIRAE